MLRVSKLADYGVILGTRLARRERELASVSQLSQSTGIPEPTVAKVMKLLSKGNVVESLRGARGGYRLRRDPSEISVLELVTALEGPVALTECQLHDEGAESGCEYRDRCEVQGNWHQINRAIQAALSSVSLASMVGEPGGNGTTVPRMQPPQPEELVPVVSLRRDS